MPASEQLAWHSPLHLCVCVFLHLVHTEHQNLHYTRKVRTYLKTKNIWPVLSTSVKCLWVQTWLELGWGRGQLCWLGRSWVMHYIIESPHKDRSTWKCVCLCVAAETVAKRFPSLEFVARITPAVLSLNFLFVQGKATPSKQCSCTHTH